MKNINLIVAASENNVIGKDNKLLWKLSDDLKFFKKMTTDNVVVMGRNTYESIGKPLPNRTNIVLTRNEHFSPNNSEVLVYNSMDRLLKEVINQVIMLNKQVFFIGGGEVYKQALPLVNSIYLTKVKTVVEGDTYFPELGNNKWYVKDRQIFQTNEKNEHDFEILHLLRLPVPTYGKIDENLEIYDSNGNSKEY